MKEQSHFKFIEMEPKRESHLPGATVVGIEVLLLCPYKQNPDFGGNGDKPRNE